MFRRAAQGSRNGPLAWAGPSSLLLRCTQAVFSGMSQQPDKPDARSQLYVDDPAIAIRGTPAVRDDTIATAVLVWRLLGFKLAFHKAQRGTDVVWIGGRLKNLRGQSLRVDPGVKTPRVSQHHRRAPAVKRCSHSQSPHSGR